MASVNKVIVVGRLGRDPELRYMPDGGAVANLSVATDFSWTDKSTGEKKEEIEWHRVTARGRLAELAGEYLKKGALVYIEGRLRTRKWQDKEGQERYTTEIICERMQFLSTKPKGDEAEQRAIEQNSAATPAGNIAGAAPSKSVQKRAAAQTGAGGGHFDDMEDDIPF